MKTRIHPIIFPLLFYITLCGCKSEDSKLNKTEKPNILFILADDQRYNTINALGEKQILTPNVDRLVEAGTSFTNCYIAGAPHGAVCSPSRAMLMTGRYYWNLPTTLHSNWAPEVNPTNTGDCEYITLPEILKQNGYHTFATGKQHNGKKIIERGFDQGRGLFLGGMSTHFGLKMKDYTRKEGWSKTYTDKQFSTEIFSENTIAFIEDYKVDKPFFIYMSLTSPHDPRTAPQEYHDRLNKRVLDLPANFMPSHAFPIGDMQIRDERLAEFPRTPTEIKKHIADYYAMIEANDYYIGTVLDALKKSGKYENTIIIFTSDNGLAVGQHGLLGKQNVYEHSIKVPMVLSGPGIRKSVTNNALIYLHDPLPTICDLTQSEIPSTVETKSFEPLLKNPHAKTRNALHFAYSTWRSEKVDGELAPRGAHRAIRKGDFKLILSLYKGVITEQLFNLDLDPLEINNLILEPKYEVLVEDLKNELNLKIALTGDYVELDQSDWGFKLNGKK